jgi:hypothetical protein
VVGHARIEGGEAHHRIVAEPQTQGNSDFVLYSPRAASTG